VKSTGLVLGVDPHAAHGVGLFEEDDVIEPLLDEPLEGVETAPTAAYDAHSRLARQQLRNLGVRRRLHL
jgi:hypothetical protein